MITKRLFAPLIMAGIISIGVAPAADVLAKKPPKTTVWEVCKLPAVCDYDTITAAIGAAGSGDEIVVHPETYFENIDFSGKAITIRSTDPGNPAVVAATVIDGGAVGRVVSMNSSEGPAILDGLTIRNGSAYAGGGIGVGGSEPTIRNCTITGNTAETGGGIHVGSSAPVISNCTITGNTATDTYGGGIAVGSGPSSGATALITGCTVTGNAAMNEAFDDITGTWHAVGSGGGISVMYHDGLTIEKSRISGNSARRDGGGIYSIYSDIHISQSVISDNTVSYNDGLPMGGGMSIYYAGPDYGGAGAVPATVDNCLITGNSATGMQFDIISQMYYPSGMGGGSPCRPQTWWCETPPSATTSSIMTAAPSTVQPETPPLTSPTPSCTSTC